MREEELLWWSGGCLLLELKLENSFGKPSYASFGCIMFDICIGFLETVGKFFKFVFQANVFQELTELYLLPAFAHINKHDEILEAQWVFILIGFVVRFYKFKNLFERFGCFLLLN